MDRNKDRMVTFLIFITFSGKLEQNETCDLPSLKCPFLKYFMRSSQYFVF